MALIVMNPRVHKSMMPVTRADRQQRLLWLLILVAIFSAGCANDNRSANGHDLTSGSHAAVPTSVRYIAEASTEEQVAAQRLLADAIEDGEVTAQEFEAMALESIACTRRAGFEAELDYFNAEKRTFSFSVRTVDQTGSGEDDDPAGVAQDACSALYLHPAWEAYDETNPRSEEEIQLQTQRREQDVFDCLGRAGFEFETIDDFMASEDVPADIRMVCVRAYSE